MIRTGFGIVLVAIAGALMVLGGCVSPPSWLAEEEAATERVSVLESEVDTLEAEVRALEADTAASEMAKKEAEAAAQSAKEMASEAEAEVARVQAAAEAAKGDAQAAAGARAADAEARTATAEARTADAEARTATAEARAATAEVRSADAQARTATAEARTAAAEVRSADAEARAATAEARTAAADVRIADVAARAADVAERATDVAERATDAEARLADAEAKLADAEAMMTAQQSEIDLLLRDAMGRPIPIPAGLDLNLVNLDSVEVSRAGPDAIYLSGIGFGDQEYAALVRYTGNNQAILEALYDSGTEELPNMDFSAPAFELVPPNQLVISNIGVKGAAYSVSLQVSRDGTIAFAAADQGHRVRTSAELGRDDLLISRTANRLVNGFGAGNGLPGEGAWTTSGGGAVVRQTDVEASHAKFAVANVAQPAATTLYGVTARVDGGDRVGYGLHLLASETPASGNTWNYGRSYLVWVTYEPGFFGSDETQVQLYESLDDNELVWRNSRNVSKSMNDGLTLEALYDPGDCPEMMDGHTCYGAITVLLDGDEQFKVAVSSEIAMRTADTVALRSLGGPVEFTDLYVHSR